MTGTRSARMDSVDFIERSETLMDVRTTTRSRRLRRSLAAFHWNIALRSVFATVCGGNTFIFVALALALGVSKESTARFTLAASLGCLFQLLILPMLGRVADRKRMVLIVGMLEPLMFMLMVLAVFLAPRPVRWLILVIGLCISSAFLNMTQPIRDDWLASLVPAGIRGRYLGRRELFICGALIVATLLSGWAGDVVGKENAVGLAVIIGVGSLFGIASIVTLSGAHMETVAAQAISWSAVVRTLNERGFRRVLIFAVLFNLPFFVGMPYYQVVYQRVIGMSLRAISGMFIAYFVIRMLFATYAGRLVDRLGARAAILLCGPVYVLFFGLMTVTEPGKSWPVFLGWSMSASADATWSVAMQACLFGAVPAGKAERPAFFAVYNVILLSLYGLFAVLVEIVIRHLSGFSMMIGTQRLGPYQILYACCTLLMIAVSFSPLLLPKPATADGVRVRPRGSEHR